MEVGILYLERLKGMLESVDLFSYPRLAASYRYGFGALRKEKFMVSRMKAPINRIYRKLFAGELAPVSPPLNELSASIMGAKSKVKRRGKGIPKFSHLHLMRAI